MLELLPISTDEWVRELCKASYWDFVQEFWEEVPGAGIMIPNWHMKLVCQELQLVCERIFLGQKRQYDLVLNQPPGTSKSTLCSILLAPWTWTRFPGMRHICASHTDTLTLDLANKCRYVLRSDKYQRLFPEVEISGRNDAKGYFSNTAGGDRLTCTISGKSPTGFHAHLLSVDDPIDPKKALSELELKNARDFMLNVIPSRKVDKEVSATVLVMQRLHVEDPTGILLTKSKEEGVLPARHVCLPAELGDNVSPQEAVWHYEQHDNLLDHVRLSRSVLKEFQILLGAYAFAGQFEQRPSPAKGSMFSAEMFNQRVKSAPRTIKRIRYWDRAASSEGVLGACFTVGLLMAKDDDGYFIEHMVRGQWEPSQRNRMIRATALRDRARYGPNHEPAVHVEMEGGSSGRDAFKMLARQLEGFKVFEDRVTGKKEVRAIPWSAQLAARNVWVVEDNWDVNALIEEHCLFPLGSNKDIVDSASGAFNLLAGVKAAKGMRVIPLGRAAKNAPLRLVVATREQLQLLSVEDAPCGLITFADPAEETPELTHGILNLVEQTCIHFADAHPDDYKTCWETPIPEHANKTPDQIVMQQEHGKALWRFILKHRQTQIRVLALCDDHGRALSCALAIADILRLPRSVIFNAGTEDTFSESEIPPNSHVYDQTKACRMLVVS